MPNDPAAVEPSVSAPPVRRFFAAPPGWPLHLACIVVSLTALWSVSYPGVGFTSFLVSALGILLLAAYWVVRLVVHCRLRGERRRTFLIAPVGGLLVLGLVVSDAPLEARWHFSVDDFNRVIAALPAPNTTDSPVDRGEDGGEQLAVPGKIGSYSIAFAYRLPAGVISYESAGSLFDDAGFGWFPEGPDVAALDNGNFERPQFTHLGGPWYSWTASW